MAKVPHGAADSPSRWRSIAVQLPLLMIGALVVSIIITGLAGASLSLLRLGEVLGRNQATLGLLQARQIEQQFSQHINSMEGLASRDSIVGQLGVANRAYADLDEAAIANYLNERGATWRDALAREGRISNNLLVLNARNHATVRSDLGPERSSLLLNLGIVSEFILVDQQGAVVGATRIPDEFWQVESWWWRELQENPRAVVRGPAPNPDNHNQQIMEFALPVTDGQGVVIGGLFSSYNYSVVQETLAQLLGQSGRAFLTDGDGYVFQPPPDKPEFGGITIPLDQATEQSYWLRGPDDGWYLLTATPIISPIASLTELDWHIVIAEPQNVVIAPIATAVLPSFVIAMVISLTAVAILYTAYIRPLSRDMRELQTSAERIQKGSAQTTQAAIVRNDELGALARSFNAMSNQLQRQIQLQDQVIAQRTAALQKQARQLETVVNVGRAANASLDLNILMRDAVNLIRGGFGHYHVAIFLIDNQNRYAVVHEATGEVGRLLKERPHRLAIGSTSLIGQATTERQPRIANNVQADPCYLQNPLLPDTRAEAVLPLIAQGQLLGVLDIQSAEFNAFPEEDLSLLWLMTDQVAAAIYNARLFRDSQLRLQETEALFQFTALLTTTLDAPEIYRRAARTLSEQIDAARCRFAYWEPGLQRLSAALEFIYYDGARLAEETVIYEAGEVVLDQAHLVKIMRGGRPQLILAESEEAPRSETSYLAQIQQTTALHLPLMTGNQAIGLVSLYRGADQAIFSDYETRLAEAMVNQAATALNNALLSSQAQNQVAQMSTLYRISQALSVAPDLRSVFEQAQQEIMSLTNATTLGILLLNEDQQSLRWLYAFEYGRELDMSGAAAVELSRGFTGYVARMREPLLLKEVTPETRSAYGSYTVAGSAVAASYLGLPLQVAQQVIGVLAVENAEETSAFSEQDVPLLMTIAGTVAVAIENQRLLEQMQTALVMQSEQGLRLQAAADVATAVSTILSPEELLQTAVNLIQERFALYHVGIFLTDSRGEHAVLKAGTGEAGRKLLASQFQMPVGGRSLIGSATATGQPRIEQNVREVADWQPNQLLPDTRAEVALPLRARGQTIGALTVQSAQINEFSPELVGILQTMSNQLATAIENANLFGALQASLTQSETLYEAGQRISAAANDQAVYDALIDFTSQLGLFRVVHIATVHPQQLNAVYVPAIWSEEPVRMMTESDFIPFADFPAGRMMLQNERVVLADVRHNPQVDRPSRVIMRRNRLNSCIMLPIQAEGEWLATLVLHQESPQPVSETELQPLLTLCAQAGVALSNQRLLAETDALYRVSRLLNQANNQQEALDITVRELGDHIMLRQCRIFLYDEMTAEGYLAAARNPIATAATVRLPMFGDYVFETLEIEQRPLYMKDDADLTPDAADSAAVLLRPYNLKSSLLVPAISQAKLIGFISLDCYQGRNFSPADTKFAQAIADQFTVSLEGIKQFEGALRRAQELVSLNQIGARISGTLALGKLAQTVYEETSQIFASDVFLLARYEPASRLYEPILFRHKGKRLEQEPRILDSNEPVYRFLHSGMPLVANPTTPIMESDASLKRLPQSEWPQSAVWLPLLREEKPAGLLCLMSDRPHAYSDSDIQLLRSIATQTGLVIANAALFQQTQANVAELRTLFNITQAAAASPDARERVANIVAAVHDSLQQANVSILLVNPTNELLETTANKGNLPPPATLSLDEGLIGQAVAHGQPLLVNNLLQLPEFQDAERPTLSQLVVPLILGRRTIGVINIESEQADAFTETDLRMVQTISVNLAAALESARLFEEIQQANQQLRELDRVKTQFLANMSHELRTPLNSIIGFSRVILKGIDGPITPEQEEDLTSIHNSGQHLLRLINDILDLAKIEAGKIALAFEAVDVEELAQNALATARGLLREKDVKLIWDIEPDLPLIEADPIRLRQILLNLLSNAAKFTDTGHIKLQISRVDRRYVDMAVHDTGPGVKREDFDKLFRAFEQADASPTRAVSGTGLGLSITKRLIELHRGEIWVESQVGRGSVFTARLPIRQPHSERPISGAIIEPPGGKADAPAAPPQAQSGSKNGRAHEAAKPEDMPTILIVEDEPAMIAIYHRYLGERPYRLLYSNSGAGAISEVARYQEKISLVLLDINLPDLNGWDVLKVIRENSSTRHLPVVVCSVESNAEMAIELGAQALLPKPISEDSLLTAVNQHLTAERKT